MKIARAVVTWVRLAFSLQSFLKIKYFYANKLNVF